MLTVDSLHVDCSDSPETSEPTHSEHEQAVNKSVENYIKKPMTDSKSDSIVNGHCSIEHELREIKDAERLDIKPQNLKPRARLESEERIRCVQFDSLSDTNPEFRKEISNLTSLHEQCKDASRKDNEHRKMNPELNSPQDKVSKSQPQASASDNCPLSAVSNPLHINIPREKFDSKVTESMPRIIPPEDVQKNDLENRQKVKLLASKKFYEEARQPLLKESIQSSIVYGDKKSNRTIQDINERSQNSSRNCLCCW